MQFSKALLEARVLLSMSIKSASLHWGHCFEWRPELGEDRGAGVLDCFKAWQYGHEGATFRRSSVGKNVWLPIKGSCVISRSVRETVHHGICTIRKTALHTSLPGPWLPYLIAEIFGCRLYPIQGPASASQSWDFLSTFQMFVFFQ